MKSQTYEIKSRNYETTSHNEIKSHNYEIKSPNEIKSHNNEKGSVHGLQEHAVFRGARDGLSHNRLSSSSYSLKSLIQFYTEVDSEYIVKCGFTTDEILSLLAESHGIVLSRHTLERILS